jgi:peptide/nickel transport system substrate-binding protein
MRDIDRGITSAAGTSISRRGFVAGTGAALLAGAAPARPARAQAKGRLVFALSSYPPSIRPWQNTGTAAATVKLMLYRGLLSYDPRGEIRGELAESWRRENDRTWSFALRGGAKFQDGEPVTAEAVRFTFDQILGDKSTAFMKGGFAALIDKIEAVNARTVRFVLKEPSATFAFLLASFHCPLISPRSTEANPVGAGPYRLVDSERGTRLDLEAFDGFHRQGRPRTRSLRFVAYPDESLRVAALRAGDVDIIEYVPWQSMEAIEKNPKLALDAVDGPFMYLVFNTQQGPFANAKLRQAVAYAVRREDIVKAAFFGRGSVLGGLPLPKGSAFADPELASYWKTDPARARALLAEAGMPNGFRATLLSSAQYGMHKDTAEVVQQSLASVGIQVELRLPDWATRVTLGNRGQYDFAVNGTVGDFNDPDSLTSFLAGGQTASYNRSYGYGNRQLDELLARGRAELDHDKRKQIYRQMARVALEDAPLVGLAWRSQGYAMQKSVKGFKNLPGFLTFYSGITIEDTEAT